MAVLKGANLALRFLLELCLLAAVGYWGFHVGGGTLVKVVLGISAPVLVAVVWGTFMAPKARVRLPRSAALGAEIAIFGLGVLALVAAGQPSLAWMFAAVAALSRLLIAVWGQESISHGYREAVTGR
ncbi:MAG: YrdB family protein [Chloroflexia bacterium]